MSYNTMIIIGSEDGEKQKRQRGRGDSVVETMVGGAGANL